MGRPKQEKIHLMEKYQELAWALAFQGYNNEEIGTILNRSRSIISRLVNKMPRGWEPKWVRVPNKKTFPGQTMNE